jgi:hypothetical protein
VTREAIIATHGNKEGQIGGRRWVPTAPLVPLDGVRLFHLRSLDGEGEAIIAVPPKDAS